MFRQAETVTYRTYADPHGFRWAVEPLLLEHEARNCLLLDILGGALLHGRVSEPYLASLDVAGAPALVALRTPPRRLILTEPTAAARATDHVAELLRHLPAGLPGVIGPREPVEEFAARYAAAHGVAASYVRTERVYECTRVAAELAAPGTLRRALTAERELLTGWWSAFRREATPHERDDSLAAVSADLRRNEERQMELTENGPSEGLWVWSVDGRPVAMAGLRGRTKHGIRVGPVYTPPELRRRGYAGALVAQLTRALLDGDRRGVYLFTDDANVTSNALYQRIGYQEVAVRLMYDFLPAAEVSRPGAQGGGRDAANRSGATRT